MIRFFKSSATFLILSTLLVGCTASEASPLKFSNMLPVVTNSSNDYVNELIEKMTLDEKLAQISCIWFDKKKVIDMWFCDIKNHNDYKNYRNAFYEFKPKYNGYNFIIPSKQIDKTIKKLSNFI